MLRRSFLAAMAVFLSVGPAHAADETPVALVQELYRVHAERLKANKPAWLAPADRARFFSRSLAAQIDRAYKRNKISFDFIYDGQDYEISELSVQPGQSAGNKATVIASFKNFKEQKRLEYDLVKEGGAWRIAEIRSRQKPAWTLTKVLAGR
jgi:ABC-type transporter MlaC component